MRPIEEYRLATFRHDQRTSVSYKSFKTLKGLLRALERVIGATDIDYVSLRVIRGSENQPSALLETLQEKVDAADAIVVEVVDINYDAATVRVSLEGEGEELLWWEPKPLMSGQSVHFSLPIVIEIREA